MRRGFLGSLWALCAVLALWLTVATVPAYAQGQLATANLTGHVTDQTGAVIPGVDLILQNKDTGVQLTAVTNEAGSYRFSFVRPGDYTLTAKKTGMAEIDIPSLTLQVAQTANVDVTMRPGTVVQQITVAASSVQLETQTSSLGGVVSESINTQIPTLLRDPTVLISLVPGVTADHRKMGNATSANIDGLSFQGRLSFVIDGAYRAQALSMVDGVDVTFSNGGFNSTPVLPSSDFTQEFKVQTNNLSADYGRGGGALNVLTKSGTNGLHGTVFEYLQNDNLNAQDLFSNRLHQLKPELKRNQYGLDVGGPIRKDKTFFFTDWERLRQTRFFPIRTRVATSAERGGDFSNEYNLSGVPINIYNPFDTFVGTDGRVKRRQFQNNQVPTNLINPFALNVLKYMSLPNNPGLLAPGGQFTGNQNFALASSAPLNFDKFDVKLDHNYSSAHRFMGRYSYTKYHVIPVDYFGNAASSEGMSTRDDIQPGHNIVFSWTWVPSPSLVVTQAANWVRFTDHALPRSFGFDPTTLGGPFANPSLIAFAKQTQGGTTFPGINIGGYAQMGKFSGGNFIEPMSTYGYQIGFVHTHGTHTLKFGFQGAVRQTGENFTVGYSGQYDFSGRFTNGPDPLTPTVNTGNGMADFLLGLPASGTMLTGYSAIFTSKYAAWYLQDDWRVTPKLTLNLGARYDFETPESERHNHYGRFDITVPNPLGTQVGPNTGGVSLNQYLINLKGGVLRGGLIFPTSPEALSRGIDQTDLHDFSPRLGFAYRLTDKLVMRGGFSRLFMPHPAQAGVTGGWAGTMAGLTNITGTIDGIRPAVTIDNPFPAGLTPASYDSLGLYSMLGKTPPAGGTGLRTPYQWQWNYGFEYQLSRTSLISVSYAGTRAHRLVCGFFVCNDQIPYNFIQKYKGDLLKSVPNPFYGIITDPSVGLSAATVQMGQLFKQWPQFTGWQVRPPSWQGPDGDTFRNTFNSLQVGVQKSYSHGLNLLLAYTLSKNLTNSDSFESGYLGPYISYQNLIDYNQERSVSSEDTTHRLVIGHVYDLPFGHGRRFGSSWPKALDKALGHWQTSGMTTLASGFPLPIGVAGVTTAAFGGGVRPNVVPGVSPCLASDRSRGQKIQGYLNPAAFSVQPNYTFGNAPRTLGNCRGDGIKNFDLSLVKFIPLHEKINVQFRTEFFNAFNRPQLGNPNTTFNSGGYGIITGQANSPRVIQFALKFDF